MNVLVTGGGGFLGRHIIKGLQGRGYEVRSLSRTAQPELIKLGVNAIQGNITDPVAVNTAVAGCQAIFHVAANAGSGMHWNSFFKPNVLGTRNLLRAAKQYGVQYFIHTSSPSAIFNGKSIINGNESIPYPKSFFSPYSETKAISEKDVLAANSSTLKTIALRPHIIWGPGDNHLIPALIKKAKSGKLKIIGTGENKVSVTHVTNAALAHLLALDALENNKGEGQAYFINQAKPVKLWSFINQILAIHGLPPVKEKVTLKKALAAGKVIERVYKLLRLKSNPPMTQFLALNLAKDHYFSIKYAHHDLGYQPMITVEEGLEDLKNSL